MRRGRGLAPTGTPCDCQRARNRCYVRCTTYDCANNTVEKFVYTTRYTHVGVHQKGSGDGNGTRHRRVEWVERVERVERVEWVEWVERVERVEWVAWVAWVECRESVRRVGRIGQATCGGRTILDESRVSSQGEGISCRAGGACPRYVQGMSRVWTRMGHLGRIGGASSRPNVKRRHAEFSFSFHRHAHIVAVSHTISASVIVLRESGVDRAGISAFG